MKLKKFKGAAAMALSASMLISAGSLTAFAQTANLTDINGHWAQSAIEKLVSENAVSGYNDGTFKPDNNITRAEFVTIINNIFGFTNASAEQFSDVANDAWYAQQMLIARAAGYFEGTGNDKASPEANITRQDAFAIIARLYNLNESSAEEISFSDSSDIKDYAKNAVNSLAALKIINGYTDGSIKPNGLLTRAETSMLLNNCQEKLTQSTPEEGTEVSQAAVLTSLDVVDITNKEIFDTDQFSPDKTSYDVKVQSDIYGVLVKAEAPEGATIKVTAGSTTYQADTWGNITPDYEAGEEIQYTEVEGDGGYAGYIIPLDQSYEGYDSEFVQPVSITVSKDDQSTTYTVTITRETLKDIYDKFTESEYTASNGETIPYELYVPSDYKEGEQLPIVFALHGSGQRVQPTFMVLKRYQMATIWAKDSEEGTRRCIVLAPQCNTDENGRNWTDLMRTDIEGNSYNPDPKLDAAYELLQKTIDEYNVDKSRVYMTGLSAGGYATYALALAHPDVFAAIIPVAGGVDTSADLSVLKGMGIWTVQATNDPLVSYEEVYKPTMEALEKAGLDVKTTLYSNSEVFYPSGHFSWTPGYADEALRQWLFEQQKDM